MLAMRPATPEDRPALEATIQARSEWMKNNQLPNWPSWGKHVHELANCMRPHGEMWVLTEDHDRIVGCTTILKTASPWAWTASEANESAFYLNGTVTDPAERHRKLGTLIADWAVDRAARENISRVRRDCTSPAPRHVLRETGIQPRPQSINARRTHLVRLRTKKPSVYLNSPDGSSPASRRP
ncbi:GNAT family N-acetyltransferase [Streptomyces sp. NBC_01142]|uniref:GNAT family N-acetyltransferase n=1 Tax=Streptomyces sp. NBC_01142 TaxID=2975865 RepID=UPI0022501D97|nr:GNAT family N-acetyltransferase [Streptomyces sp. NBC_01142]MCX4826156.1 GNAT family N-acetyltransferase [Streptomyces sp. NBC_01142]